MRTTICKLAFPIPGEFLAMILDGICNEFKRAGWTDVAALQESINGINFLVVTAVKPQGKDMD